MNEEHETHEEENEPSQLLRKVVSRRPLPISAKSSPTLQEKIIAILSSRNEGFTVSFAGMKRLLGDVHQQKLSKSIQRLLEAQILQKDDQGYRLSPKFYHVGSSKFLKEDSRQNIDKPLINSQRWEKLAEIKGVFYLSKKMNPRTLYEQFKGRWFGRFRFVGGKVSDDGAVAEWISEDLLSQLYLFIKPREIIYSMKNPKTTDHSSLKSFLLKTVAKPFDVDLSLVKFN